MSFDILFEKNFSMSDHVQGDAWSLQMEYARQQANADQQYEQWVDSVHSLRQQQQWVDSEYAQEVQERLAVLERNPPDPTHVQVGDPGSGNGC